MPNHSGDEKGTTTAMSMKRIAIIGLSQESNSFTGLDTTLAEFAGSSGHLHEGAAVIERAQATNTVIGGFLARLEEQGWEAVPVLDAYACPGGPLDKHTYEALRERISAGVGSAGRLDGVLISLHGAMLAHSYPDPEGDLLSQLRELLGPLPIAAVLDLHANVSAEMVAAATMLVAYKTYPHVDLAESGHKAATLLVDALQTGREYYPALLPLPMLLPSINMRTNDGYGPMYDLKLEAENIADRDPQIAEIGIYGGFPFADVSISRASVLVYTGSPRESRRVAREMATRYWKERQRFLGSTTSAERAFAAALAEERRPTVLADVADNPASGGAGDTTTLLKLLLEYDVEESFAGIFFDPDSVGQAITLGLGGKGKFRVGGKINPQHGGPAEVEAEVIMLSEGNYVCKGPMLRGTRTGIGRAALLRSGNVEIAVAEGRSSVNDPAMLEILGVNWQAKQILALKVKGHFRAAFGHLVGTIINAEAPGAAPTDLNSVPLRAVTRPIFPLDEVDWQPDKTIGRQDE